MAAIPVTTGLRLLLDARTITGLANGDRVAAWADQSGQANHAAQSTDANRPTFRTNVFGANPTVRFAAANEHLHGGFSSWGASTGITMLLCLNTMPSSQTAGNGVFSTSTNSTSDFENDTIYVLNPQGQIVVYHNSNSIKGATHPSITTANIGVPFVIGCAIDATNFRLVVNSVIDRFTHSTGLPPSPTKYSFGFINAGVPRDDLGALYDCHFAAVYTGRLTDLQCNDVASWMLQELVAVSASGGTSGLTGLSGVGRLGT